MLSGGWRRGTLTPAGSKNLPNTAPVILEVQYDYSYRGTDGRTVSMQEGERFLLIKKTNADWWQARRLGAEARAKPVYVPASYVLELPVSISRGPAADGGGGACERLRRTQAQGAANEALFCRSMENLSSRASTEKPSAAEPFLTPPLSGSGPGSESGPGSAHLLNPGAFLSPGLVPIVRSQSSSNLPQNIHHEENPRCRANTHSQFSSLDYKSQSAIGHRWAEPPFPSPWQQPLQTLQHWEQFCDPITGRCYYVNAVTRERSWKPPRRSRENGAGKQEGPAQRDTRHLSLALQNSSQQLSPDFYYSSHDANGWQLNQSIQRAVSSDAISSASCRVEGTPLDNHTYGAPLRNRTFSGGVVNNLSHSHSMILPTQRIPATGKCDLRMMLEAPSPESEVHTPGLEKAGMLNKTKIAEGGRKLRKSWSPAWVVLVGNSLVFFKDPKSQNPESWKPGSSRPESSVDLRGAQLQWAAELSSKRNVFKLRTVTGNEFLLQSDSDALIRDWYRSIQNIIHRLDEENPLDNVLLFSLRRAGSVELLDHSGDEDEERGEVKEASLPRSRSNLEHAEQKRVKSRLKKLILRRPPLQALHEKGLIKDQVFGCALELLCKREKSSVPQFVRRCTEAVERRGLESDGIYRVSGNLAVVQKLRFAVNHEHLDLDAPQWEDIHVISGALKLFFRELPNPLIPFNMYHSVIRSVQLCDHQERLERLKLLVSSLPACNRDTLRHMIQHLRRVMESSDSNRMSSQNIGIVFGPSLMRPENDSGNIAINMVYQNQAIEILLSDYQQIFEHEPIRGMLTTPTN